MATPWAVKMYQILRCDWLPKRRGLRASSRKQTFNFSRSPYDKKNPLLTELVRPGLLDIGLVLFMSVYGPQLCLDYKHANKKKTSLANIQSFWPHTWSIIQLYQLNVKYLLKGWGHQALLIFCLLKTPALLATNLDNFNLGQESVQKNRSYSLSVRITYISAKKVISSFKTFSFLYGQIFSWDTFRVP